MSSIDCNGVLPVIEIQQLGRTKSSKWKRLRNRRCDSEESIKRLTPTTDQMSQELRHSDDIDSTKVASQYSANSLLKIITPVSICVLLVVAGITSIENNPYVGKYHKISLYSPFHKEENISGGETFVKGLNVVLYIVGGIFVFTMIFVLLYKYRCNTVILVVLKLFMFAGLSFGLYQYVKELLYAVNLAMDSITMTVLLWNFVVLGMICIFWNGPALLRNVYHIACCVLAAFSIIRNLPPLPILILLGAMGLYDMFAVLYPKGPLRLLVNIANERNEPLFPSLIYSSTVMISMSDIETVQSQQRSLNNVTESAKSEERHQSAANNLNRLSSVNTGSSPQQLPPDQEQGVKLGLGDFVFYSVLVGKVATFKDWNTTIACFFAVVVGLCITLFLLCVYRKPLPALPISIALGLISFFATRFAMQPFLDELTLHQVLI